MEDKSIIIIGNGGSLLDSKLGKKIDEFDEVIRINDAYTIGYEKDVGSKRSIWSTYSPEKKFNKYIRHYKSMGYDNNSIIDSVKGIREIWYVSPVRKYLHPWKYKILGINKMIKRYESLEVMNEIEELQHHATTGFILIYISLLTYDKVYTAGFDFNGRREDIEYGHYFSKFKPELKHEVAHKLDMELEWFMKKVDESKIVDLQLDTDIVKSKLIDTPATKQCNRCNKESTYYSWEHNICHYCEGYL